MRVFEFFLTFILLCSAKGAEMTIDEARKTLGIFHNATQDEIQKAYKKKAMREHPDRNPEAPETEQRKRFQDVQEAYRLLKAVPEESAAKIAIEEFRRRWGMGFAPDAFIPSLMEMEKGLEVNFGDPEKFAEYARESINARWAMRGAFNFSPPKSLVLDFLKFANTKQIGVVDQHLVQLLKVDLPQEVKDALVVHFFPLPTEIMGANARSHWNVRFADFPETVKFVFGSGTNYLTPVQIRSLQKSLLTHQNITKHWEFLKSRLLKTPGLADIILHEITRATNESSRPTDAFRPILRTVIPMSNKADSFTMLFSLLNGYASFLRDEPELLQYLFEIPSYENVFLEGVLTQVGFRGGKSTRIDQMAIVDLFLKRFAYEDPERLLKLIEEETATELGVGEREEKIKFYEPYKLLAETASHISPLERRSYLQTRLRTDTIQTSKAVLFCGGLFSDIR